MSKKIMDSRLFLSTTDSLKHDSGKKTYTWELACALEQP